MEGVVTSAADSTAASAFAHSAAQKDCRVGHERKGSPSYAFHIDACRNQNKLLRTAVAHCATGIDDLEERDENPAPVAKTGPPEKRRLGLHLQLDADTPPRLDDALKTLRLASPDSTGKIDGLRYRTLSVSSRTSVDSLRTQGAISAAKSGSPQDAHAAHRYNTSPLCTSEVYELSHFLDANGANAAAAAATVRNPNKVLLTIDMRTSIITVANSIATSVFGYSQSEFIGMPFTKLLHPNNYLSAMSLLEEYCGPDGNHMRVSEQLLIAVDKSGIQFPVSLWMKLSSTGYSLAILEPVERTTGVMTTNLAGDILDADPQLAPLLGFHDTPSRLLESSVRALLPRLVLPEGRTDAMPKHLRHQHVTGHIQDGNTLPLTVLMRFSHETDPVLFQGASFPEVHTAFEFDSDIQYLVVLYHNVTSLMTVRLDGRICSCDATFCSMLLGYGQAELQETNINELIPGFLDEVSATGLKLLKFNTLLNTVPYNAHGRRGSVSSSPVAGLASGAGTLGSSPGPGSTPTSNELGVILERDSDSSASPCGNVDADEQRTEIFLSQQDSMVVEEGAFWGRSPELEVTGRHSSQSGVIRSRCLRSNTSPTGKVPRSALQSGQILSDSATSNEAIPGVRINDTPWQAGDVVGLSLDVRAAHCDGFALDINVQVKHILFDNDDSLLCLWVKRDYVASPPRSISPSLSPRDLASDDKHTDDDERGEDDAEAFKGPYAEGYTTLRTVGRGAFGDVKLAAHNTSGNEVIVKCIGKKDVLSCSWTSVTLEQREQLNIVSHQSYMEETDSVPTELFLLRTLEHPNIVNLVDVFETEHYYQLVMAKHGDGMDLFEFIDQEPAVDEPLTFYIFSQVVDAVDYLHQRNVIHRDIKDENIIIDQHFHVKLIDFGSAAFMKAGQLFDTFCGTIEYCSPEVLSGNTYRGPELEMWTLGVTLFTLVFFENPFKDADDIIGGHLSTPFAVSPRLTRVLLWLLHPDPASRCTIPKLRTCPWMKQTMDITDYDFDKVLNGELSLQAGKRKLKTEVLEMENLSAEPRRLTCMSR